MEQKRKLITASNFGKICKLRKTTNTAGTIKSILYNVISTKIPSLNHGKIHEIDAKKELGKKLTEEYNDNIETISCGLFIDKSVYFLGASPDGFVEKIDSLALILRINKIGSVAAWLSETVLRGRGPGASGFESHRRGRIFSKEGNSAGPWMCVYV
jgi:hypothetical protein